MAGNLAGEVAGVYRSFAEREARGRSPLYETLARGVAGDPATLDFLAGLPPAKRQPNLLFASVRYLAGMPRDWSHFRALLVERLDAVKALMLARRTQTNEPARCATLLPLLSRHRWRSWRSAPRRDCACLSIGTPTTTTVSGSLPR